MTADDEVVVEAGRRLHDVRETWPVVHSDTRFEGRIVTAYTDTVRGPDGEEFVREVVRHHGAVAVVAVDDQDHVFVLTQFRHPVAERLVELPAGLLDVAGEDPEAAARRELAEEAGLRAERWSVLVDVYTSPGISDERVRIYLRRGTLGGARAGRLRGGARGGRHGPALDSAGRPGRRRSSPVRSRTGWRCRDRSRCGPVATKTRLDSTSRLRISL